MSPTDEFSLKILAHLVEPAARSLVFGLAAAVALAALRVKDVGVRSAAWRAVLWAALAMPITLWTLPAVRVSVPDLLGVWSAARLKARPAEHSAALVSLRVRSSPEITTVNGSQFNSSPLERAARASRPARWPVIALAVYILVAGGLVARFASGLVLCRRLRRLAPPVTDPRALSALGELSKAAGLPRAPALAASGAVAVPLTLGILRPMILLPASWREWAEAKMRAVLAHELSHVARRDPLTQTLAALHRGVFWFSPLAWWIERRLAELAELASDEFALGAVGDRGAYAKILLDFMEAMKGAPGRVRWQGAAMARGLRTERRLEWILAGGTALSSGLRKLVGAGLLVFAAPVLYFAATLVPSPAGDEQAAPAPPAAPAPGLPARPSKPAPVPTSQAGPAGPHAAPTPAARPSAPKSSVYTFVSNGPDGPSRLAVLQGEPGSASFSMSPGFDDENFVIVSADSTSMSGSSEDLDHAKSLRGKIKGDFIWFRRDDKGYVIRDQAMVKQAKEIFAPQEALARRQEELGKMQELLGAKQEELGKKQTEVSVEIPDLTADLKKIEAELSNKKQLWTQEKLAEVQAQLAELQAKLGEQQANAGAEQTKLGAEQEKLGAQQGVLGAKQEVLGREQERVARETIKRTKQLLDSALSKGVAEPEPR